MAKFCIKIVLANFIKINYNCSRLPLQKELFGDLYNQSVPTTESQIFFSIPKRAPDHFSAYFLFLIKNF